MKNEPELTNGRITVTPLSDEELTALRDAQTDEELRAAYGEMLDGCLAHPDRRVWYAAWKIVSAKNEAEAYGDLCFKGPPDEFGRVEIGYGIDECFRSRGIATEAARLAGDWALLQRGVQFVSAQALPDNIASCRVLEKSGFIRCGTGFVAEHEEGCIVWTREKPTLPLTALGCTTGILVGIAAGILFHHLARWFFVCAAVGLAAGLIADILQNRRSRALKERLNTMK